MCLDVDGLVWTHRGYGLVSLQRYIACECFEPFEWFVLGRSLRATRERKDKRMRVGRLVTAHELCTRRNLVTITIGVFERRAVAMVDGRAARLLAV